MPATLLAPQFSKSALDDAALIERALNGEEFALDELYRRHAGFVAAVIARLLRRPSETEDLVQETFMSAFSLLSSLSNRGAFRSWLARIAVTHINRRRRRSWWLQLFSDSQEEEVALEAMASSEASAELKSQLLEIDAQLRTLPEELSTAWTLRFVLGLSLEEVATACSCSLATVKRRLQKAQEVVAMEVEVPS